MNKKQIYLDVTKKSTVKRVSIKNIVNFVNKYLNNVEKHGIILNPCEETENTIYDGENLYITVPVNRKQPRFNPNTYIKILENIEKKVKLDLGGETNLLILPDMN